MSGLAAQARGRRRGCRLPCPVARARDRSRGLGAGGVARGRAVDRASGGRCLRPRTCGRRRRCPGCSSDPVLMRYTAATPDAGARRALLVTRAAGAARARPAGACGRSRRRSIAAQAACRAGAARTPGQRRACGRRGRRAAAGAGRLDRALAVALAAALAGLRCRAARGPARAASTMCWRIAAASPSCRRPTPARRAAAFAARTLARLRTDPSRPVALFAFLVVLALDLERLRAEVPGPGVRRAPRAGLPHESASARRPLVRGGRRARRRLPRAGSAGQRRLRRDRVACAPMPSLASAPGGAAAQLKRLWRTGAALPAATGRRPTMHRGRRCAARRPTRWPPASPPSPPGRADAEPVVAELQARRVGAAGRPRRWPTAPWPRSPTAASTSRCWRSRSTAPRSASPRRSLRCRPRPACRCPTTCSPARPTVGDDTPAAGGRTAGGDRRHGRAAWSTPTAAARAFPTGCSRARRPAARRSPSGMRGCRRGRRSCRRSWRA
ncbi:MAG: hypothetical protein M0C28_11585 [Candidatus Moduliflexus flocculans]|nr:hypothetical protein [Candidatus Moduliflexus flocculans]